MRDITTRSQLKPGGSTERRATPPRQAYALRLQRLAGNRAVSAMLRSSLPSTAAVQRCGAIPADVCPCHDDEGKDTRPAVAQRDSLPIVQRGKENVDVFADPVSAGMTAGFDGLTFEPPAEATYRVGPKQPQLIAIIAKRLAGGQYTPALGKQLYAWGTANGIPGAGGFAAGATAKQEGESISRLQVSVDTSLKMIGFLRKKGVQGDVTKEQEELLALGRTTFDLAADVLREAKKRGEPLPAWYSKQIFDQEMTQQGALLREYHDALKAHRGGESGALDRGTTAVGKVFDALSVPAAALDAIRTDNSLATGEKTKGAYQLLWGAAGGGTPNVRQVVLFLAWSRSQPESVSKAKTDASARALLLERYTSFGHDVTFTSGTGNQTIRDTPATANARPFDATLTASPAVQPPLFDAAFGTDYRFTMAVQFPHVTDALARWAYTWERVKVPEDKIGTPVEKLRGTGTEPTTGEVATVRFGRATQYAKADIERVTSEMTSDLGAVGVGATSLVAANAILRYLGTGIRLGLELLTMPQNQKPIVLPEPGLYMVRCAASPVFEGETAIKRAPSVAYFPLLARDPNEMAVGGVESAVKGQQATTDRITELRAELGKPLPAAVKAELQRELDLLVAASGPMSGVLEARKKEIDRLIADIKAGKTPGDLAEAEKQREQLDKIVGLRAKRKLDDKTERLTASFVSDTGQKMNLELEAQDKPKSGGSYAVYVSDTTTAKSGAETGYGKTREVAIERAVRKILEGTAGYGRGRVAVKIGSDIRTIRIEASLGSLLMESIDNVAMVASLAAVAAAPFTGGASLVALIPIGIAGAIPAGYRIATRIDHGTFSVDLETAMDIVNVAGSVIGLGRLGAMSLRMVRVGRAMMFVGVGADALGVLLMQANLVAQLEELQKLPEGERAAALLMVIGQAMLAAGIMVGGTLAERAQQRHAEAKAKAGGAASTADHLFAKAKTEQELATLGKMDPESESMLRGNEPLRGALVESPSAANALKKCASPCLPPGATAEQVRRLERLLNRLKETGAYDEAALKDYFHDRRNDLNGAITKLEGVKTAADLNATLQYYNSGGKVTVLPPQGDPRLLAEAAERSHDLGVKHGKAQAGTDGLTDTGFDNPIKGGKFGQGFDDVMHKGANLDTGDVFIVEYKGGTASLAPDQMSLDWVVGNIRRLANEGGLSGQAWARILAKALREGRLKGVAYKTPVVSGTPGTTVTIGSWNYPKTRIPGL